MLNINNEPRNNEYLKLKELFNVYLRNPNNKIAELSLKKTILSGEELIYLLDNYLNKINKTKNIENAVDSLVEECNSLINDLEESLKDKTGTLIQELKSTIYVYRDQIKYKKKDIEEIKKSP